MLQWSRTQCYMSYPKVEGQVTLILPCKWFSLNLYLHSCAQPGSPFPGMGSLGTQFGFSGNQWLDLSCILYNVLYFVKFLYPVPHYKVYPLNGPISQPPDVSQRLFSTRQFMSWYHLSKQLCMNVLVFLLSELWSVQKNIYILKASTD